MKQITCILAYRQGDGNERLLNLEAVLRALAGHADLNILVVEQDTAPRLDGKLPHPGARRLFVYNPGPFNKSWALNVGARAARTPWLMFMDADLVFGTGLGEAFALLEAGYLVVKPYVRLLDLNETESRRVRAGEFDWVPERCQARIADREARGEFPPFAGGAVMMARRIYDQMGGWDERFVGWGGEDDAMSFMLERARVPGTQLDVRPAVHLNHPRTREATAGQPHYRANLALLHQYRTMSDDQLRRSAEVRRQLNGHRDKYRPSP